MRMRWVLGYMGSGCKYVGNTVAFAAGGKLIEEPALQWPHDLFFGLKMGKLPEVTRWIARYEEGHGSIPVTKEEFAVPLHLVCIEEVASRAVYILRRSTLANVEWLLRWNQCNDFQYYWDGIIAADQELAQALCPQGADLTNLAVKVAVAHKLQTRRDLALCRERDVRVFAYEDLSADYNVEWPRLLKHLGLPAERAAEKIQHEAAAPHVDLFRDERIMGWVSEIDAKAEQAWLPST